MMMGIQRERKDEKPPSSAAKKEKSTAKKTRVRETCNQIFSEKNSPPKPRFCSQRFTLNCKIKGSREEDDDDVNSCGNNNNRHHLKTERGREIKEKFLPS